MGVSKVELLNGETLVDLTKDTVTAETLGEGATAHNSKGEEIVGTMKSGDMLKSVYDTDNDGKVDNANNSEKLGGMSLYQVYDEMIINSTVISGRLADAVLRDGVIKPHGKQPICNENGNLVYSEVDYYPFETLSWLITLKKKATLVFNVGSHVEIEDHKEILKIPIKYDDGTIVETPIESSVSATPSELGPLKAYTLALILSGDNVKYNDEGKIDSIFGWITGVKADDSVKLDGLTHMDIVSESVASTGTLPRGICEENGVISPDEPWFEFDEDSNIQIGGVTPSAYDFIWFTNSTCHIILSVKVDIEPVDGKLPLKIKANFLEEELPNTIIDVPANSPLKADKTYHFIVDSRSAEIIETENGYEIAGLKGAIFGLVPETDTVPTEGSTNLITSGAVYDVIGDINSILDNVNGEVV